VQVVDAEGVETQYPAPDRQCVQLCEQIAQEGTPVTLTLVTGKRDGVVKLKAVQRFGVADAESAKAIGDAAELERETLTTLSLTAKDIPF
jgi:hypothetical protein